LREFAAFVNRCGTHRESAHVNAAKPWSPVIGFCGFGGCGIV
jgi:hypothetical protein